MPIRLVNRRGKPVINEDGEPIMERVLRPKYGMPSSRHAAASLFIEEGFSPKRVQDLMGHSTIQMTFDTCGHLFPAPADDQVAMPRLQARLIG
jgi:integrase